MMQNARLTAPLSRTPRRMKPVWLLLSIVIVCATSPGRSQDIDGGRIATVTGDITYLSTPPSSVELFMLESDTDLFVFAEKQGLVLQSDLPVNIGEPGDYFPEGTPDSVMTWESLNPGTIPAGTAVDCYYFHFDNETYNDTLNSYNYFHCIGQKGVSGTITFKNPVLGLIIRGYNLNQSNPILGIDTVEYDTDLTRSFPGINIVDGCHSDHFILSKDRRTLQLTNHTDVHHDNYRVVVQSDGATDVTHVSPAGNRKSNRHLAAVYSLNGRLVATGESARSRSRRNGMYIAAYRNEALMHLLPEINQRH